MERNAIDICDNYSIVSHWDTLCFSFDYPIQDMFAIEHAGSAMNNQVVAIQVLRKIISGNNVDMQLLSDTFAQHSWKFHSADVFGQWSMSTGFGYQDPGIFCQLVDDIRSFGIVVNVSLVAGK